MEANFFLHARILGARKNAREKYGRDPEYFDPEYLFTISPTTIKRVLRDLGIRYVYGGTKAWKGISEILVNDYRGDPRNLTPKETTLYQKSKGNFKNFQISEEGSLATSTLGQ